MYSPPLHKSKGGKCNLFENYNDILNLDEMCEALHIGKNTAYHLSKTNQIKYRRIGKVYKIPKKGLIDYFDKYFPV